MEEMVQKGLKCTLEKEGEGNSSKWEFWEHYWDWRSASGHLAASRVVTVGQPRVAVSFPESNELYSWTTVSFTFRQRLTADHVAASLQLNGAAVSFPESK